MHCLVKLHFFGRIFWVKSDFTTFFRILETIVPLDERIFVGGVETFLEFVKNGAIAQ